MARKIRRRSVGAIVLLIGALALIAAVVYRAWQSLPVIWSPIRALYQYVFVEGVAFSRALTYFDASVFVMPLLLVAELVFGLLTMGLRRRRAGGYFLLLCACAITLVGNLRFGWYASVLPFDMPGTIEVVAMVLIAVGAVSNIVDFHRHHTFMNDRWNDVYAFEGMRPTGMRGDEVRREVRESRRDKRYK